MKIRFHLDEHIHPGIAIGLRARGIEVSTTPDVRLSGQDDVDHLEFCRRDSRVIVTHDDDFVKLHAQISDHRGIVYCHQTKYGIGELLRLLLLVHACYDQEGMRGRIEFL